MALPRVVYETFIFSLTSSREQRRPVRKSSLIFTHSFKLPSLRKANSNVYNKRDNKRCEPQKHPKRKSTSSSMKTMKYQHVFYHLVNAHSHVHTQDPNMWHFSEDCFPLCFQSFCLCGFARDLKKDVEKIFVSFLLIIKGSSFSC